MARDGYQGKGFVWLSLPCSIGCGRDVKVRLLPKDVVDGKPRKGLSTARVCWRCYEKQNRPERFDLPMREQSASKGKIEKRHRDEMARRTKVLRPGDPGFDEIAATVKPPIKAERESYKDVYFPGRKR